jgi:hypothetical protein
MSRRAFISRVPGAAQHEASRAFTPFFAGYGEVMRCRPGTVTSCERGTVPDQRCTTRAAHSRCTASGTREMNRRAFISLLGAGAAAAWPRAARAQRAGTIARLGYLSTANPRSAPFFRAFEQRLRDLGYIEGENIIIEYRNVEGDVDKLPELAADLVVST